MDATTFIIEELTPRLEAAFVLQADAISHLGGLLTQKAEGERVVAECHARVEAVKSRLLRQTDAKTIDLRQAYVETELAKDPEALAALQVLASEQEDMAKLAARIEAARLNVRACEGKVEALAMLARGLGR